METETTSAAEQVVTSTEGATPQAEGAVEAKETRTYTEAEWNARQSSWDKQFAKATSGFESKINDMQKQIEEFNSKRFEIEESNLLRKVESEGGDVNWVKEAMAMKRQAQQELAEARKLIDSVSSEAKAIAATKMAKQYGLGEDAIQDLMESKDPSEMELKALRMERDLRAQAGRPPAPTEKPVAQAHSEPVSSPQEALKIILANDMAKRQK